DRDHVDVVGAQVAQGVLHLLPGLAEAEHDPGLGGDVRVLRLELAQQGQRPLVVRARPDVAVQVRHGFEVVVEHVRRVGRQDLQRALHPALAAKVRGQDLDLRARALPADGGDAVDEMLGPAITQVVAVDAGHHHVAQAHVGDGFGQPARLVRVRRLGPAVGDVAEAAAAGADLAEDHERGGAVAEALVDVRAAGVFAHRDQAVLAQLGLELLDRVAGRDADPDPRRLAQHWRIGELHRRTVDLFAGNLLHAWHEWTRLDRDGRIAADNRERDGLGGGVGHGHPVRPGWRPGTWLSGRRQHRWRRGFDGQPELRGEVSDQRGFDRVEARRAAQVYHRGHGQPGVAAGVDPLERRQVHVDVEGQSVEGATAPHADAERGDLGAGDINARCTVAPDRLDVPVGQGVDDRLLDPADVLAHTDLEPLQVE